MPSSTTTSSAERGHVLCVAPNWLGDAVLSRPALARLGRSGLALDVWAPQRVARLLAGLPGVRIDPAAPSTRWQRFAAAWGRRRAGRDAAALVLAPSWSAAAAAAIAAAPVRVGFASDARRVWLTHAPAPLARSVHLSTQYTRLAEILASALGVTLEPADTTLPAITATAEEIAQARALGVRAGFGDDYVVLLPGARFGPAKRWPPERFAAVGAALAAEWRCAIVLAGEAEDAGSAHAVRAALPQAIDLAGQTGPAALVGLLAGARAVVANDSGGMHVASALGRPVVGIFGSTDPQWTGPSGARAVAVVEPPWCAPCFAPRCREDFACMLAIAPERVIALVHRVCADAAGLAAGRPH